jgi:CRP-like cAMP-binding protein
MVYSIPRDLPLLAGCDDDDAADGLARFRPREFAPGEALMLENEPGGEFYLIVSGIVAVSRSDDNVWLLSGPTFVGERSMLGLGMRSATVRALTHVDALATGQLGFDRLLRLPGVGRQIAVAVAERAAG